MCAKLINYIDIDKQGHTIFRIINVVLPSLRQTQQKKQTMTKRHWFLCCHIHH